jgi:Fe-S cluster assembly scaffold protein SufB
MVLKLSKPNNTNKFVSVKTTKSLITVTFKKSSPETIVLTNDILGKDLNFKYIFKEGIDVKVLELYEGNKQRSNNVVIEVGEYAIVDHKVIVFEKEEKAVNFMSSTVMDNAKYDFSYIDLSTSSFDYTSVIKLEGNGATGNYHGAAISAKKDIKNIEASIENNSTNTSAMISNYGVAVNESRLSFQGIGRIKNGAKGSKAYQKSNVIVFDKASYAKSNPFLDIKESDVEAGHAAAVGTIDEEILFYLCSRGLTRADAKKTIVLGYIKPVLTAIDDERVKEKIITTLERKVFMNV